MILGRVVVTMISLDEHFDVVDQVRSIAVRLTPRAARDALAGFDERGRLLVRVTAPPVDGAANAACVRLVARALGVAPSRVSLIRGRHARDKVLEVPATPADLRRLGSLGGARCGES